MARVPREAFVPEELRDRAYEDRPLPLGHGQTISQPYIVALTCEALGLDGGERVLDVGTGSGYAAAVLAELAAEVHTIERIPALAEAARASLAAAGYDRVAVHVGDGTLGLAEHAPYDAIAVAAAARRSVPPRSGRAAPRRRQDRIAVADGSPLPGALRVRADSGGAPSPGLRSRQLRSPDPQRTLTNTPRCPC